MHYFPTYRANISIFAQFATCAQPHQVANLKY